jgi:hypothetical protein
VSKRFVPIGTVADAERPEITAPIRQAAALDRATWAWACGHRERHDPNVLPGGG